MNENNSEAHPQPTVLAEIISIESRRRPSNIVDLAEARANQAPRPLKLVWVANTPGAA